MHIKQALLSSKRAASSPPSPSPPRVINFLEVSLAPFLLFLACCAIHPHSVTLNVASHIGFVSTQITIKTFW